MAGMTRRHILGGAVCTTAATTTTIMAASGYVSKGLCDDVINVMARVSGVTREAILSPSRDRPVVWARQRGMYVYNLLASRSYPETGRRFGNRDHTTVLHAIRKIEKRRSESIPFDHEMNDLIHACMVEAARLDHRMNPKFERDLYKPEEFTFDIDYLPVPPWRG